MTQLQGSMRKDYVRGLAKDSIDDVLTEVMIDLIKERLDQAIAIKEAYIEKITNNLQR